MFPRRSLSNKDLESMIETTDEWISKAHRNQRDAEWPDRIRAASDLAASGLPKDALEMAGLDKDEIDLIIMCTITPDTHCPAGANWLQAKMEHGPGGNL